VSDSIQTPLISTLNLIANVTSPAGKETVMSMQHRLPDHAIPADTWTLFCAECSLTMRMVIARPNENGREIRTYGCTCGHSERINLPVPPLMEIASTKAAQVSSNNIAHSKIRLVKLRPSVTTSLSIIPTTKAQAHLLQPSARDAMLAIVPNLRAFAISLSHNVDHADDLVQETLLRAMANIDTFQSGTNMAAWLFTILRNLFRSEYRKRRREVEDADGGYTESLKSHPEQYGRVEFEEFRVALAKLHPDQREALLLVGASGFTYDEAAKICRTAVGTIKSRVNRARTQLSELLALDSVNKFGPDPTTRAILTAGRCG
jgi:RNA polymerase sigma-70 factor, ECF subfamily